MEAKSYKEKIKVKTPELIKNKSQYSFFRKRYRQLSRKEILKDLRDKSDRF